MNAATRLNPFPINATYAGIYAHGVEVPAEHKTVYVSGMIGESPQGELAGSFRGQCRQALMNLEKVLKAADLSLINVVKLSFFLTRRQDMDDLVAVRKELLEGVSPAITTVFVAGLVKEEWLVEVEAYASG